MTKLIFNHMNTLSTQLQEPQRLIGIYVSGISSALMLSGTYTVTKDALKTFLEAKAHGNTQNTDADNTDTIVNGILYQQKPYSIIFKSTIQEEIRHPFSIRQNDDNTLTITLVKIEK